MLKFKNREEALAAFKKYDDSLDIAESLEDLIDGESAITDYWLKEAAVHIRAMYEDFRSALYVATETDDNPIATPERLSDLKLSARTKGALSAGDVDSVSALTSMTELDLLKLPNIGRTTLSEINARLSVFGLKLRGRS